MKSWELKGLGHVNKGNDHQLERLLTVRQILFNSTLRSVWMTLWRIYILMLQC